MTRNALNWIEIPVIDMQRAKMFYAKLYDVAEIVEETVGGLVMAFLPSAQGCVGAALVKGEGRIPSQDGVLPYLNMETKAKLDATIMVASAIGGSIVVPVFDSGRWGWLSYIIDTEGNKVALHAYSQLENHDSQKAASDALNPTRVAETVIISGVDPQNPPMLPL